MSWYAVKKLQGAINAIWMLNELWLPLQFNMNTVNATLGEYTPVLETLLQLSKIAIGSLETSTCDCIFGANDSYAYMPLPLSIGR